MKRFFRPETFLFLIIWLLLMISGRSRFFQDPGTFWHTVVGEVILQQGIFDYDIFTFTFYKEHWVAYQWLGEVIMAAFHRVDRFDSLLLLSVTALAGIYTWLGVRLLRSGLHWSLVSVLIALAMAASSGHFHARPLIGTIALFAITMAFLTDYEQERIGMGKLVWLIPLFVLWTNIHGGMLGGLATFAIAIAGWVGIWMLGWWGCLSSYQQLGFLILIWIGCALTAFVNPFGVALPETWKLIYESKLLPEIIVEHGPLNWSEPTGWSVLAFGLVYLILLAGIYPEKPKAVWLLPLIWLGMSLIRVRHAPLFAVGAIIAIADFFPYTRYAQSWESKGSDLYTRMPDPPEKGTWKDRLASMTLPALLVLVTLGLQATRVSVPVIGHDWARLDPKIWPLELVPELEKYQYTDRNDRTGGTAIFNEYVYGGFLMYYTPGYRVFIDDRCELFGDEFLKHFVLAESSGIDGIALYMDTWQTQYGDFLFALTKNGSPFDAYFRQAPEWELIKETPTACFYGQHFD